MRKSYKKNKYKAWHDRRSKKIGSSKQGKRRRNALYYQDHIAEMPEIRTPPPVKAPENLCLLKNTEECLSFFQSIRKEENVDNSGKYKFVQMSLSNVTDFDYSTICVLVAIKGDLISKGIYLRGDLPKNESCKERIFESGLLNDMYNEEGKQFPKSQTSELLFIEKGTKKFTTEDNIRISKVVKDVVKHLTGKADHCRQLRRVLLEICGNSIEWAETKNKQWLLGVKYDDEKVIFTITDVGKGILNTLEKKLNQKVVEYFSGLKNDEILKGAFVKKYGSSSKKVNRNKGLPSIKSGFDDGLLKNLKVLTNDVILHYDDEQSSKVLAKPITFNGTLYRWIVNKESLYISSNENN